jgi:ATP-dependent helicase Lhr and Lhr-like helicase
MIEAVSPRLYSSVGMSAPRTELEQLFSPAVAGWFQRSFAEPTPAQRQGWPPIADGEHTLLLAPTGSGKTLAAFLAAIDRLTGQPPAGTKVLYVSPLRALNHDIEKNLRAPLAGIQGERQISVGLRTGDTSQAQRAALRRHPPDILITTPESLYLMLTSGARETLRSVETVIVDEIHAMAGGKRGVHLALSLERLDHLCGRHVQRVGLSATQRPLAEVASYLGGAGREVTVVDAGSRKVLDLEVIVPVPDMRELGGAPTVEGEPRQSIWPAIYPRLLELVQAHRSTLVFVNNRRAAERIANRLNALAGEDVARAHHGSIAREQRLEIEELLKDGSLPALVATSSLELGIDMGAIDLVIQIESPKSVAAGLQRVGRAGHQVGEPSVGRFFPKFRGDLLETAVVTRRMREGEIEHTRVPRQPLDVLAQQVVACVVMDDWDVGELHQLVCGAHSYRELSQEQFEGVLDMLAGRYPSDEFAELRPRLVWDRTGGRLRARAGSRRLAVTSSGTIPDRGLYGVFLADSGARVGELDEEMVYEARQGEVFQLGASSWRIEQITRDRVLVSPAPGVPGKIPFWKGDAVGRPYELGRAVGEAARTRRFGELDELAASNLHAYLDDQEAATGVVPSDRQIVVERFRDEIGDWRVCVLSPFGGRVHAPWAMAIEARMSEALGLEVEATWSDDGIAIRLPDADTPPPTDLIAVPPDELDDLLVGRVAQSPLFAGRFRENAARALLLPRRRPGTRMPLWQQRLKAHDLQQVAIRFGSFPILLETYREVLSDVFEVPRLKELLEQIARGSLRLVELETAHPSPFASSLLFDYIAGYMYEGDAPAAERRMQALSLDRALLAELLAADEVRELLDADAIDQVEQELQGIGGQLDADRTHDLLRRLGDLGQVELAARGAAGVDQLLAERRAVEVGIAGERRLIAAEDAALYRDALGAVPPPGLPAAFLQPVEGALERLVGRYGRTHGPFTADRLRARLGVDVTPAVKALVERGELLEGGFLPGGAATELVAPDVLRRLRRRTIAVARRAVEPVDRETLGRFLPAWHGIGRDLGGRERLREAVSQLQGLPLPVAAIESDLLPARIRDYRDEWLDAACSGGEVVWVGAGRGRVRTYLREDAALLHAVEEPPEHPILDALEARGASFFADLAAAIGGSERTLLTELWELVWAGHVTNDAWHPLRSGTTLRLLPAAPADGTRPSRRLRAVASLPAARGRWSLVRRLLEPPPAPRERARALAETLLERQGVVTRQGVLAEGVPGGFSAVYGELRLMEEAGICRRGYFVEGLGGAQFALAAAVERLRDVRERSDRPAALVLSAIDPANPYGASAAWPEAPRKLARVAGAWVVLVDGRLGLVVERGGRGLVTFDEELLEPAIAALADAVRARRIRRLAPERVNGERLAGGEIERLLLAHGFLPGHRRLVLRA